MLKHIAVVIFLSVGISGLLGYEILELEKLIERNTRAVFNKEQFFLSQKIIENVNETLTRLKQDSIYLRYSFAQIQLSKTFLEKKELEVEYWKKIVSDLYGSFMISNPSYNKIQLMDLKGEDLVRVSKKKQGNLKVFQRGQVKNLSPSDVVMRASRVSKSDVDLEVTSYNGTDHIAAITPVAYGDRILGVLVLYYDMEYILSILHPKKQGKSQHTVLFEADGALLYCSRGESHTQHIEESRLVALNPTGYAEIPESYGEKNVMMASNIFLIGDKSFVLGLLSSSDEMIGHLGVYKEKKQRIMILLVFIIIAFIIYFTILNASRISSREKSKMLSKVEKLNVELTGANNRLMEIDRKKTEFLNIVAHDIRTPLTSIRAYADMLLLNKGKKETLDKVYDEFLGVIVKESERLGGLINDYLDLSKIESGIIEFDLKPCNLLNIVEDLKKVYNGEASEKKISFKLVESDILPDIFADSARIQQVVSNLLSNAIKYTGEGGEVIIRLEKESEKHALVTVEDTGPGIHHEDIERVFDRFYRVDHGDGKAKSGTGLGLPICKSIVVSHKGRIWAQSEPSKGSRFFFTVPFAEKINNMKS
ncbi:MAG: ATP-binding protein [Nitrospinota bacterium]